MEHGGKPAGQQGSPDRAPARWQSSAQPTAFRSPAWDQLAAWGGSKVSLQDKITHTAGFSPTAEPPLLPAGL